MPPVSPANEPRRALGVTLLMTVIVPVLAPFPEVLHRHSANGSLLFLGFEPVPLAEAATFHERYEQMLVGMPTTVLVNSCGDADLLA